MSVVADGRLQPGTVIDVDIASLVTGDRWEVYRKIQNEIVLLGLAAKATDGLCGHDGQLDVIADLQSECA